jgi:hypothetical protein
VTDGKGVLHVHPHLVHYSPSRLGTQPHSP